jgi:hypothetical protein
MQNLVGQKPDIQHQSLDRIPAPHHLAKRLGLRTSPIALAGTPNNAPVPSRSTSAIAGTVAGGNRPLVAGISEQKQTAKEAWAGSFNHP